MVFLDNINKALNSNGIEVDINRAVNKKEFPNGFNVPPMKGADGNGLPSQKIKSERVGINTRSLMHWFVPEFGVIKMYVNPSNVVYSKSKQINKVRTKGGYSLQYWGENLSTLKLSGTTGSSGIEGINVLEEIYRAEQYAFDAYGLTIASDNSASSFASSIMGGAGKAIGSAIGGTTGGIVGGFLGEASVFGSPGAQALAAQTIPALADFAFGIELFYLGWVFRGYFESMTVTESASSLGLFDYDIQFVVTERRGYRVNNLPWQKSAIDGPSSNSTPLSFMDIED